MCLALCRLVCVFAERAEPTRLRGLRLFSIFRFIWVLCTFDLENLICANLHGQICVQHVKTRDYTRNQIDSLSERIETLFNKNFGKKNLITKMYKCDTIDLLSYSYSASSWSALYGPLDLLLAVSLFVSVSLSLSI